MIDIPTPIEENIVHVFPSEVAASFWRCRFLRTGTRRALREDTVISWDVFKERAFDLSREEKPVNSRVRLLFAEALLRKNRDRPFLSYFIPSIYAADSEVFLSTLASLLPRLGPFIENGVLEQSGTAIPEALNKDLRILYHEYYDFLYRQGFYEPAWIVPEAKESTIQYILHFPEVIEDYELFRQPIEESKHLHPLSLEKASPKEVYQFSNSWEEAEWICSQIREHHSRGVPFSNMAVTSADPYFTHLLIKTGKLYSLPFVSHQGTKLIDYPGARFFSVLAEIAAPPIPLESAKKLLLDQSVPWKNRRAWKDLLRFGLSHYCIIGYGDPVEDPWLDKLKKTGKKELENGYSRLGQSIIRITKAKTFAEMKRGIIRFSNEYFEDASWSPEALAPFQRCLDLLNRFIETEATIPDLSPASPFSLFVRLLSEQLYVPQGVSGGIALFPYRVSAGIDPSLHFIAGIDQKSIEVSRSPYPFLKEDMITSSSSAPNSLVERDFTAAFLCLYIHSGKRVVFSGSEITHQGPQIFPAPLLPHIDSPVTAEKGLKDPIQEEMELWEGKEGRSLTDRKTKVPSFAITPLQRRGLLVARETVFQKKGDDFTERSIENSHIRDQVKTAFREHSISEEDDYYLLSPSRMESLRNCPFSYLFERVLRCESPEYEINITDPKWEGVLLHEILRGIFQVYMEEELPFPNEGDVDYSRGERVVADIIKKAEDEGKSYLPPAWAAFFHSTVKQIQEFLSNEGRTFPGYRVYALEEEFSRILPGPERIALRGRIDRVSRGEEGCIIVDYKRSGGPTASDMAPQNGPPRSFQLPFYGFLLEEGPSPLQGVMVYIFKKGKYQTITGLKGRGGKALLPLETFEDLVSSIPEEAKTIIAKINAGDFTIPKEEPECKYCRIRGICRSKYAVKNRD